MIAIVILEQGRRTREQERWLGSRPVRARVLDADRNGRPERIAWQDAAGRLVQVWTDRDRDGRADRVQIYRDGRLARVLGS